MSTTISRDKMIINKKNMPKKSQTRFYGFVMTDVIPRALKSFRGMDGHRKYLWDKPGQSQFYQKLILDMIGEKPDYIQIIIYAVIALYQKERVK
jgi:hypothetical protein